MSDEVGIRGGLSKPLGALRADGGAAEASSTMPMCHMLTVIAAGAQPVGLHSAWMNSEKRGLDAEF